MQDSNQMIRLIMGLRRQGISDARVLSALERVPREAFVPEALRFQAYDDAALPIECGQTISQPFIVAFMTQALEVGERMKVLEVGTGSGYQTAILALVCRRVYTIERFKPLLQAAEARFAALDLTNITSRLGDGTRGWPEQAPFDRILVTAASEDGVPPALVQQLREGGVLVAPIGGPQGQWLVRIRMTPEGPQQERLMAVRFVPIVEGVAKEE